MKQLDENKIRRIIVEEVRRALAERQHSGNSAVAPAEAPQSIGCAPAVTDGTPPAPAANKLGHGLALCTLPGKIDAEIIGSLKTLQAQGVACSAFICPDLKSCEARSCFSDHAVADCLDAIDVEHFPAFSNKFQFLLLPGLSTAAVVQAIWGKTERRAVKVIVECLRWRLPVFLCDKEQAEEQAFPGAGDPTRRWPLWVRENMRQFRLSLSDWGLREVSPVHLANEIKALLSSPQDDARSDSSPQNLPRLLKKRIFLTARDIRAMIQDGEEKINLPPNATLTAEAADLASHHNLHISFK